MSERDVVALSAPDYVSTSRDDDLWGEAGSGGGGEASALVAIGLSGFESAPGCCLLRKQTWELHRHGPLRTRLNQQGFIVVISRRHALKT